jgi:hypothetical protein
MALLGQASGGWTESSSALRILNVGIRNSIATGVDDAFTQANPVGTASNVSAKVDTSKSGVLSGSVAFSRPDAGSNYVGGPGTAAQKAALNGTNSAHGYHPLGFFINSANGNPFENTPGVASGVLPYVCAMGSYGDALYETKNLDTGAALTYLAGIPLIASLNGFIMPKMSGATSLDTVACAAEQAVKGVASTILGIVRMVPDAVQTELVFDSRV